MCWCGFEVGGGPCDRDLYSGFWGRAQWGGVQCTTWKPHRQTPSFIWVTAPKATDGVGRSIRSACRDHSEVSPHPPPSPPAPCIEHELLKMVGRLNLQGVGESATRRSHESLLDSPDSGLPPSPSHPLYPFAVRHDPPACPDLLRPDSGFALSPSPPPHLARSYGSPRSFYSSSSSSRPQGDWSRDPHSGLSPWAGKTSGPTTEEVFARRSSGALLLPYSVVSSGGSGEGATPFMVARAFGEGVQLNPGPATELRCTSEVCYKSTCHFQERLECSPGLAVTSCSHTIIAWPGRVARHHSSVVQLEPRQRPRRHSTATIVYPKQATATFRTTLTCGGPRHATSRFTSRVHLERVNGPGLSFVYQPGPSDA